MKRIVLLWIIVLNSLFSFAGWNRTMLRLREERGRTISVSVDGRRYQKMARTLTVGDLPAGMHRIKIYRYNSNGHGYAQGVLIYDGRIEMKPGRIYYATVFRNGLDIEENCCLDDYGHWNNNDRWDDWDDDRESWNNNHNWDHKPYKDPNPWQNPDEHFQQNDWNSYTGVMSTGRFQSLIDRIRKASFETSKVSTANTGIRNNKITVQQLIGILGEFSFESTKLEFAKSAYAKIADQRNFYLVNDVFTFQSSKDEINDFIQRQQ
ncbi:MAG: DUF4476 domain-containing protein [Bacteroidota bacterium]|nr:MAG: DUF4476 domain-containing protein [Bacteroidota bacterium]